MVDPTGHDQEECAASERNSDTCSVLLCETPTQQTAGLNEMQWCLLGSTWLFLPDMGEENVPRASAIFISPAAMGTARASRSYFSENCHAERAFLAAGLLGSNWLFLLDMAKKNVLQAGATVIPAAATMYCMGIEARTEQIAGFDFSTFNKYRSAMTAAEHEQCRLEYSQVLTLPSSSTLGTGV